MKAALVISAHAAKHDVEDMLALGDHRAELPFARSVFARTHERKHSTFVFGRLSA